jgi:ubiquinone/menaquinone biosynthesis C-methylase UbiE
MAPGWEDRREWLMDITGRVNDWLVDKADPQQGRTILDIAAGMGDLGCHVAARSRA